MARITVEDCQERVDNRFLLVQMAIKRVHQYREGYEPLLETRNKEVVTALRAIPAGEPGDRRQHGRAPYRNYSILRLKCVTFQTLRRPCAGDGDSNLTRGLFSHLGTDVRLRGHQNNSLISNVNCPKRKST